MLCMEIFFYVEKNNLSAEEKMIKRGIKMSKKKKIGVNY